MDAFASEWLNLALRWIHITVGIAWIGTSFFFVWLENHLRPPVEVREGVHGEVWMVHGGGFYQLQKFLIAPPELPKDLHWFKWEAYATWISGFLLLGLVYFAGASAYLVKPGIGLAPWLGVVIALAVLVFGWALYDAACRRLQGRNDVMVGGLVFAWTVAVACGLSQIFTGRATYIMIGAMLGTIMAANVLMVIIPNQRRIVAAMLAGRPPDAEMAMLGARGKQRSLHNNYLTLPVLFTMISNHYPGTFAHPWNWAVLAGLFVVAILVRHYFNLKNRGDHRPWLIPAAAAALIALAFVARPAPLPPVPEGEQVAFHQVEAVVQLRCAGCHAAKPTHEGFDTPPKGVVLETSAAITAQAPAIYAQAVATEAMPLGNVTEMTGEERALLGRWIAQGAKLR